MDLFALAISFLVLVVTSTIAYVLYMSRYFKLFTKMGIRGPTPWPLVGNVHALLSQGFVKFHSKLYNEYYNDKVYGVHEPGRPFFVIKDLDMIRDIMIKNFSSFVNRRIFFNHEPFDYVMTSLKDEHWRNVRNHTSPAFTSGKLKRMFQHVEETSHILISNLRQFCKDGAEVELKDTLTYYSMDVIASTGFGVKLDSLKDKNSQFPIEAKKVIFGFSGPLIALTMILPGFSEFIHRIGLGSFPLESSRFFIKFTDEAMANRSQGKTAKKRDDFLQIMINAEQSQGDSSQENGGSDGYKLTRKDIHGQALIFILASFDNISTVVSFTLFMLAHHPECCRKVQEELDTVLGGKFPLYESVQELNYLDMCMNETLRLYPPGFIFDRQCNEDCTVQGIDIPKGAYILFPAMAIHRDPKYWPEPDKFDPERFTPEQKATRHPFAHLPFGYGPRNCIGMRLAQIQVKTALAAILQEMTPVPCEKSVYPIEVDRYRMKAVDDLWVKFVLREDMAKRSEN